MRTLYTNPNAHRRTMQTERVVRIDPRLREPYDPPPVKVRPLAKRGIGKRSVQNLIKHMRHIRRCRTRGVIPHNVPTSVLRTVVAWNLV